MKYDFDRVIDRRNTYSVKYDMAARGKPDGVLPLWVADMDFQAPPCVVNALAAQSRHGIFGYSDTDSSYFAALRNWFAGRFNWHIEEDWLVKTPGVVNAIHAAIRALTKAGDSVLIQQPVYYPFASAVRQTERRLVINELLYEKDRYLINFADFERKIIQDDVKMFILCNPHNPVGRVWTREELTRLGDICLRHGVLVISDEIHQDFIFDGHRHLVFTELDPSYRDITVTCTAPSKTFNIPGLQASNIFISNTGLREKFLCECNRSGLAHIGVMGIVACRAAYADGDEWLGELLRYLAGNVALMQEFFAKRLPYIKLIKPEGTYLAWLDFRALGLGTRELDELITHKAKLWLSEGTIFGAGGAGFQRMNFACPRSILLEALERLEKAVRQLAYKSV